MAAASLGLPVPEPLKVLDGNASQKWKKFKQKWNNYEIATGIARKEQTTRVATLLTVIGEEAVDVYNTFTWEEEGDHLKIAKVLEKFEEFCNPRKNTIYERYKFFSKNQEEGESIDHYVTVLKTLAETCEFGILKESLIRDRIVFGITDSTVRERLLRDPELTLCTAIEKIRSAEYTKDQLKQMKDDRGIESESVHSLKSRNNENQPDKSQSAKHGRPIIKCKYCGKQHPRDKNQCPAYGAKCQKCGIFNHFAIKCNRRNTRSQQLNFLHHQEHSPQEDHAIGMLTHCIGSLTANETTTNEVPKQLFATMKVNDKVNIKFQLDCGATCNILPLKDYSHAMGHPNQLYLEKSRAKLTMYNGNVMYPVGKCKLRCTRDNLQHLLEFQVVDANVKPLLSAEACQRLQFLKVLVNDNAKHHVDNMELAHSATYQAKKEENNTIDILKEYADVFEGLGCLEGTYHIEIDSSVKPVVHPPRRVPVTLREPLEKELQQMVNEGILAPVSTPTDWVSSMVTVVKPDKPGKLRICIDPRDLNRAIKRSHYPMPTIEEVATKLSNAKIFSVLDAKSGFWQVSLDEASSKLTTFNTPFGRFRWLRMPFGISSAPEEFQKRMNNTFEGLKGTAVIADDLLVFGEGEDQAAAMEDHDKNLRKALERAREKNLTLNREKVKLRLTEVPYIGHLLTSNGLKPDPNKIEAIKKMPKPTDVQSVKRFLGMVNYLSKFLPHLSTVTEPLCRLEDKDVEWHWNEIHQKSFEEVKQLITAHPVLLYYDVKKEVTLQCDASQTGIGAALLQNGQPVAFTSRALTTTERNYAQIEKELLAIVHACERFDQYIFGRHVTIETDHKPLEVILHKPLLAAPKRLQRMMMRLQKYSLKVIYRKGTTMYIADTLSRAYLTTPTHINKEEEEFIRAVEKVNMTKHLSISPERLKEFQTKTEDDATLQEVKKYVKMGWPDEKYRSTPATRPYYNIRDEISVQDGIIFKGERVIVPLAMRSQMLKKIHSSHIGTEGCLRRAREILYWPGMNAAIKEYISSCEICNAYRTEQQKEPLIPQNVPDRPWSRIAVDLFTIGRKDYIVIVDDYSNFFEVNALSQTTATAIISSMKSQFARYGIPDEIRSDNGPQFASTEFQDFAQKWDFKHITSSPYYAQSNGKAENAVKTAKKILKKAEVDKKDPYLALLDWRNTPTEGFNSSPVQRLMGRRTRTLLPTSAKLLKPKLPSKVKEILTHRRSKQTHYFNQGAKRLPELRQGDVVRVKPDSNSRQGTWKKGTCYRKVAPRSYEVICQGKVYRRNRKHLARTNETAEQGTSRADETVELPETPNLRESLPAERNQTQVEDQSHEPPGTPVLPSDQLVRRTSRGRLLKTPDYYY